MIEIDQLTFAYPDSANEALRGINLSIAPGSFVAVAGPSGGGKSTLLRTLNGLVPHLSGGRFGGSVFVAGYDTRQYGPRVLSRMAGFVFQDPDAQAVAATVEEEVAFSMEQLGVERMIMRKRVEEVLDLLGLTALRHRAMTTLSGGERQRVALAGALALQPAVLVLDEPTSQLDPWGADDLIHAIEMLNADLGTTIVVAEHRLDRLLPHIDQFEWIAGGHLRSFPSMSAAAGSVPDACLPALIQISRRLGLPDTPVTVRDARRLIDRNLFAPLPDFAGPSPGEIMIEAKGVSVRLDGVPVLQEIDLTARRGEIVALMGRNGSGKTTLIRTLFGFVRAQKGEIRVCDLDMRSTAPSLLGKRAAYLPQQSRSVLFNGTLRDEIAFTLKSRGSEVWPDGLIRSFDLSDVLDRDTRDLSEGQRLRAALIAILTGSPEVVLLDEPTRGLDGVQKDHLCAILRDLRSSGVCIVLATHDVELIATLADLVVLMGGGTIVAEGTPRDVLSGSLAYSTVVNRIFGPGFLTIDDLPAGTQSDLVTLPGDTIQVG